MAILERIVHVRFHGELCDFLPRRLRSGALRHSLSGLTAVKDAIEALGVPHVEVDVIEADGAAVGFGHRLRGGERVEVFPGGCRPDVPVASHLLPPAPAEARFILDVHLGRLARYLRMLGFDCLYRNDYTDPQIARCAATEDRIVLTRDTGLLKRNEVRRGRWVRAVHAQAQLAEVVEAFGLRASARPFSRCTECNAAVEPVAKEAIVCGLRPGTRERYSEFYRCSGCGKVFWEGSHVGSMKRLIERVGV